MILLFDFAGVISKGRLFPVIAENLSKKFGIEYQIIKDRLYAHQDKILLGNESMEDFWKKACDGGMSHYFWKCLRKCIFPMSCT